MLSKQLSGVNSTRLILLALLLLVIAIAIWTLGGNKLQSHLRAGLPGFNICSDVSASATSPGATFTASAPTKAQAESMARRHALDLGCTNTVITASVWDEITENCHAQAANDPTTECIVSSRGACEVDNSNTSCDVVSEPIQDDLGNVISWNATATCQIACTCDAQCTGVNVPVPQQPVPVDIVQPTPNPIVTPRPPLVVGDCNKNGRCDQYESPDSCPADCACNHNGSCEPEKGENRFGCFADCANYYWLDDDPAVRDITPAPTPERIPWPPNIDPFPAPWPGGGF